MKATVIPATGRSLASLFGISCPVCGQARIKVVKVKSIPGGRRRRVECRDCACRFTTVEQAEKQKKVYR